MVEFALKFATYNREVGGFGIYDSTKWDEFEKITMGPAIDHAKRANLINEEHVEQLRRFKDSYRNPYNHYNIKKITAPIVWEKAKILNVYTGSMEERDIAAKDSPVIQAQAKPYVDAATVLNVFTFADSVVKLLLSQLT